MKKRWKYFDFTLVFTPLLLTAFGVIMIYSASMVYAVVKWDYPSNYYLIKQLQWFGLGIIAFVFTMFFPYRKYQYLMKGIVGIVLFSLFLVLIVGKEINGAKSWMDFGFFNFQPSELAKIGLIMYLASVYARKQSYIQDFGKAVLPPLLVTVLFLGLVFLQPDVGTAVIIFLIACSVIFSSGIKFRHLTILIFLGIIIISVAIPSMITDERIARFAGAYQPFQDPNDDGYHLIQSYIAIGTGGLQGEGLGQGVQKLGYLLEPHTDFILAVIAEELGLIGVLIVIGLLSIIVLRGLFMAIKCDDAFGSLLAIGISSMIGIQASINMGAISGLLPITGVPLPFVSYGGSSLIVLLASVGILNNIALQVRIKDERTAKAQPLKTNQQLNQATNYQQQRAKGGKPWENRSQ